LSDNIPRVGTKDSPTVKADRGEGIRSVLKDSADVPGIGIDEPGIRGGECH